MTQGSNEAWIDDIELENVEVKWNYSHMDGREDTYNAEGDHNFVIILPEAIAGELSEKGWTVKEVPGREEGDPPEFHLKAKISFKYRDPAIFFIKRERRMRASQADLADLRRDTCEQLDVILTPSRWVNGPRSGVTAYVKEMYAQISESRFAAKYADYEEV